MRCEKQPYGNISQDDIYDYCLFLIEKDLCHNGSSLSSFPSMLVAQKNWNDSSINEYIVEQLAYDTENELFLADQNIALFNNDQKNVFDQITDTVHSQNGRGFFLHGPGGTGKTFIYKTLCHSVCSNA
jgi:DNA replication protein DnaC